MFIIKVPINWTKKLKGYKIYLFTISFFWYLFSWMTSTKIYAITFRAKQKNQSDNAETSYINVWANSITNNTRASNKHAGLVVEFCVEWIFFTHECDEPELTHPPAVSPKSSSLPRATKPRSVPEILVTPESDETAQCPRNPLHFREPQNHAVSPKSSSLPRTTKPRSVPETANSSARHLSRMTERAPTWGPQGILRVGTAPTMPEVQPGFPGSYVRCLVPIRTLRWNDVGWSASPVACKLRPLWRPTQ